MRPLAYVRSAIQQRLPTLLPDHEALRSTLAGLSPDERASVDVAADGALNGTAGDADLQLLARIASAARSRHPVAAKANDLSLLTAAPSPSPARGSGLGAPSTPTRRPTTAKRTTSRDLAALPKVRISTTKAGAVFELDRLRSHDNASDDVGGWTVRIEAAKVSGEGMDWGRKITLQVMQEELPLMVAVIMGWRQTFEVSHHGHARNKKARLENQENGSIYLDLREGARGAALPIERGHRFQLAMLCAGVLDRNHGVGGAAVGLDVLRDIAHLL